MIHIKQVGLEILGRAVVIEIPALLMMEDPSVELCILDYKIIVVRMLLKRPISIFQQLILLLLLLFFFKECLNLVDALIAFFFNDPILVRLSSSEFSKSDFLSLLSSLPENPSKPAKPHRIK